MCPSGWSYYAGTNKCFYVNSGTNTYSAQLQNCQSLGGTLAVIKSAEENKFVSDYAASVLGASTTVTKYAFIGLSNSNGAWKWVDSTAPSYTNWQPNQPDGTGASAASITPVVKQTALDSWGWKVGGWDDNSQTSNQYAVCQMNANGGGDSGTCSTPYTHINMSLAGSNFWDEAQLTYVTKTPGADGNFVYYVSKSEGESLGLISVVNGQARMAAESKTVLSADSTGRKSIRVNTKYLYNGGLLVLDFEHMPVGKGTWPAFWTTGWVGSKPVNGEIDILEEGAGQTKNRISLHTTPECTLPKEDQGSMYTGAIYGGYATNCSSPGGCSIQEPAGSFGPQVNNDKGGVVATEWIKDKYIAVWHFKRSEIPADLIAGKPCPSSWGKPVAYFRLGANCPPEHFNSMRITINTSFCGPMARVYFDGTTAAEKQSNCEEYVRNNPNAFVDAYWLINSIKVYTK
ncbi:lectin c-type domain-containing protein [Ditylenchus destructor]|nr:lectin c-type domain-containing protein [Ditylenchus destructor]